MYRLVELEDFTRSHYLYNRDRALERIERYIHEVETKKTPVFSMQGQVQFVVAAPDYVSQYKKQWFSDGQRYLGHFEELFDDA